MSGVYTYEEMLRIRDQMNGNYDESIMTGKGFIKIRAACTNKKVLHKKNLKLTEESNNGFITKKLRVKSGNTQEDLNREVMILLNKINNNNIKETINSISKLEAPVEILCNCISRKAVFPYDDPEKPTSGIKNQILAAISLSSISAYSNLLPMIVESLNKSFEEYIGGEFKKYPANFKSLLVWISHFFSEGIFTRINYYQVLEKVRKTCDPPFAAENIIAALHVSGEAIDRLEYFEFSTFWRTVRSYQVGFIGTLSTNLKESRDSDWGLLSGSQNQNLTNGSKNTREFEQRLEDMFSSFDPDREMPTKLYQDLLNGLDTKTVVITSLKHIMKHCQDSQLFGVFLYSVFKHMPREGSYLAITTEFLPEFKALVELEDSAQSNYWRGICSIVDSAIRQGRLSDDEVYKFFTEVDKYSKRVGLEYKLDGFGVNAIHDRETIKLDPKKVWKLESDIALVIDSTLDPADELSQLHNIATGIHNNLLDRGVFLKELTRHALTKNRGRDFRSIFKIFNEEIVYCIGHLPEMFEYVIRETALEMHKPKLTEEFLGWLEHDIIGKNRQK